MIEFPIDFVLNAVILLLLVVSAIAVVISSNLLVSTVLLSVFSLLMSAEYLVLGAPDVSITEAAVGAGISTILLLLALLAVGDKEAPTVRRNLWVPFVGVVVASVILIYATAEMPPFGSASGPTQSYLAPYYLNQSYQDIGIPNVVTSILASYRGFDTFGETCVILTAAIAILLLLGGTSGRSSAASPDLRNPDGRLSAKREETDYEV